MKPNIFRGTDPIAILELLARITTERDHRGGSEKAAVWCFQLYLANQAHALLLSPLSRNTMAVDAGPFEMLRTYLEVVYFLLRKHAADEVVADAHTNVAPFLQGFSVTKELYSSHL